MSRMPTSFAIGRPTRSCAATGQTLNVGDHYVAALIDTGEAMPARVDYALSAWPTARPPARKLVAFWKSTVPDPQRKVKPVLDDGALLDLFESTAGEAAPPEAAQPTGGDEPSATTASREAIRFVLAILLVRRRLLSQEGTGPGGTLRLRRRGDPRPPEGPPLIDVRDPGLDEATLADVLSYLEDLGAVAPAGEPARAGGSTPE